MGLILDRYTLEARLMPVLITVFPVAIALATWLPRQSATWNFLGTIILSFGLTVLFAQIGRDIGKIKERDLFAAWGGTPTTLLLSYGLTSLDRLTLTRYHDKLKILLPDLIIPGLQEEIKNPSGAYRVYETCVQFLRERTRDPAKFPLVLAENINYGFRRNLWAMKPVALCSTVLGMLGGLVFVFCNWSGNSVSCVFALVAIAINGVLLLLWVFVVNPKWVRVVARAYAERLLGSLDTL